MKSLRLGSALAAVPLALACAGRPPPGPPPSGRESQPEIILTTEARDREAGERESERVATEMGLVEAPELVAYLERVGRRLVAHAPRRTFSYSFQIVDQEAPNAFALPGGFVYVSRGLLALANSEDEIAGVLAHEIAHVAARHAAARQQVAATAVNPLMLPGVLVGAVLGEGVGGALAAPFQIFNIGYVARYSRDQEREADRLGQEIAAGAGYDPAALAAFLRALENEERLRSGVSRLPGFLDTHPGNPERAASAAARARELGWDSSATQRESGDYLAQVDGLVLGSNPREGVFQDDRFLHPELGFTLRFPAGWKTFNTPRAVGAVAALRDAETFLEFQSQGSDPRAAADAFLADLPRDVGISVSEREDVRVGGLPAHRLSGRGSSGEGNRYVVVTWIAHDDSIYRITGSAPLGPAKRYRGALLSVSRSFRPLTPAERASVRATRLRIARARADETLESLSRRTGNTWDPQRTAVMNGLFTRDRLEAGRRIKVSISEPYSTADAEQ